MKIRGLVGSNYKSYRRFRFNLKYGVPRWCISCYVTDKNKDFFWFGNVVVIELSEE